MLAAVAGSSGVRAGGRVRFAGRLVCLVVLGLVLLATRAEAATITVTTAVDEHASGDGSVSLREAIKAIDAGSALGDADITAQNPGTFGSKDRIDFDIPGGGRPAILVGAGSQGPLPAITKAVTIDGYSQPGASPNTLDIGDNAQILVALSGGGAGSAADGLLVSAPGVTIEGLDVFGFSLNQIELQANGDTVAGDDVGFDTHGGASAPSGTGVVVTRSSNSIIGGTSPQQRNVISKNTASGVVIAGTATSPAQSNVVQGNYIGTTPSGTAGAGNARSARYSAVGAVLVDGGDYNSIGGTAPGAGNVISGNGAGVNIRDGGQYNVVQSNLIGVAADGHSALPNLHYGVRVGSSGHLAAPNGPGQSGEPATSLNFVGSVPDLTTTGTGNVIAFNGGDGVQIQGVPQNNSVQREDNGNSVLSNSIYSNHGLGIDLVPVTGGKPPNNLIRAPSITAVTAGSLSSVVRGSLRMPGSGGMSVYVELFVSSGCGPAPGQGQTLLGSVTVRTDSSGRARFSSSVAPLDPGQGVTATATNATADPTVPAGSQRLFDTSEFSVCVPAPRLSATTVVCRPAALAAGHSTRCTVTVRDASAGRRSTPTGRIRLTASASGSFPHGDSCRLSFGRCAVVYRPRGRGKQSITADYGGDASHGPSTGHAKLTVSRHG